MLIPQLKESLQVINSPVASVKSKMRIISGHNNKSLSGSEFIFQTVTICNNALLTYCLHFHFQNVMKIASLNLAHNTAIDNGMSVPWRRRLWFCFVSSDPTEITHVTIYLILNEWSVTGRFLKYLCCFFWFSKSSDTSVQRFDKSLEEFYALCDQLELCLVRLTQKHSYLQNSVVLLLLRGVPLHSMLILFWKTFPPFFALLLLWYFSLNNWNNPH